MVPGLCTPFMGPSLVYMMIYVWSREFPDAPINIYGVVTLKVTLTLALSTLANRIEIESTFFLFLFLHRVSIFHWQH